MKRFSVNEVFSYVGVAAMGVAGFAWFNGNTDYAIASVVVGAAAFYATASSLKESLADKERQEEIESIWRREAEIRDEISKTHDRIDSRVTQEVFDGAIRNLYDLASDEIRDRNTDNESVYRHMETEMNAIHAELSEIKYRLVQIEANEFACCSSSSKRK